MTLEAKRELVDKALLAFTYNRK